MDAKWERRRSSRPSRIADDLTHNKLEELSRDEIIAYVNSGMVTFPEPMKRWMANPGRNLSLGRVCLVWLRKNFFELELLRTDYV